VALADDKQPLGTIVDTNSSGRFDLLVYDDGFLAVKGTYVGVALRAAGPGAGVGLGAAATAGIGAATGGTAGHSYEQARLAQLLKRSRAEISERDPHSFFMPQDSITEIVLRKRWHGCRMIVKTHEDADGRRFEWKPALNDFSYVHQLLASSFGERLTIE
jgi:hypothetical protein